MSRIAVIGSGISGMAAAYLLSRRHEVWLFEKDSRLGGHTHTHRIETGSGSLARGTVSIDTGFIVHNDRTYPNFVRLLAELGVERQPSSMSFGVSSAKRDFEYSSRGLNGLFAVRTNFLRPSHYRFLREILRFNREAAAFLRDPANADVTLGEYLRAKSFSSDFANYYLYPMASAVWSTSIDEIEQFPAFTLIRFFDNHGFLGYLGQPTWYTIKGGSHSYIPGLTKRYKDRIRVAIQISRLRRTENGVDLLINGECERFDEVVFACHAPQALALLGDATTAEEDILRTFQTSANQAALHTDSRLLPRRPAARASWNYLLDAGGRNATLTYHMNRLQNLAGPEDYCVTLNATATIEPGKILRQIEYDHPLYNLAAIRAQGRWAEISGRNRTHYCGAYWFYGFHEDGLNSAIRVAHTLGVEW